MVTFLVFTTRSNSRLWKLFELDQEDKKGAFFKISQATLISVAPECQARNGSLVDQHERKSLEGQRSFSAMLRLAFLIIGVFWFLIVVIFFKVVL